MLSSCVINEDVSAAKVTQREMRKADAWAKGEARCLVKI
jgi:hypothetical protein